MGKKHDYLDPTEVAEVIKTVDSFQAAAQRLGVKRHTITSFVRKHQLHIDHFRPAKGRRSTPEEILRKNSKFTRGTVRKTVLRLHLLEERCSCGLAGDWNGKPLTLELEHKDGDRTNNVIDNLEFLCPNCHSQTPHHRGKNRRRYNP